jgi:hypothetical protein
MDSRRLPTVPGLRSFEHSAPLVLRSSSQADDEAALVRRACTTLGFRAVVAFRRRRLGTPLTKLDEHLISLAPVLHSILPELWHHASGSGGVVPPTLFTSNFARRFKSRGFHP